MNDKERFHAIMNFEACDRVLYWEQGYWGGTVERWYAEGLPRLHGVEGDPAYGDTVRSNATPIAAGDRVCHDIREAAGLDLPTLRVPVNLFLCPAFEEDVVEEGDEQLTLRDEMGILKRMSRARDSIPYYLSWPVADMADFERLKDEKLNADTAARFPDDWSAQVERLNAYEGVVALGGHPCGFFGTTRFLMGEIALLTGFLETPDLVRTIIDHLTELWSELFARVLEQVKVDCIHIWEDMAFKTAPLISPLLFGEFLVPAYRRLTDVARSYGVDTILVDSDGDCRELIPLWLEGGVSGLYPFEVPAGMDVREIRDAFPSLQMLGGVDKRELALGPERVDAELRRRIPDMSGRGGFIPMGDHQIPPDVSWENYLYYRRRLAELWGRK